MIIGILVLILSLDRAASQVSYGCCTQGDSRQYARAWDRFWLATNTQAKVDVATAILAELRDLSPDFGEAMAGSYNREADARAGYVRFVGDLTTMATMLKEPEVLWAQAGYLRQRRDDWGSGTPEDFMALAEATTKVLSQISPEFDLSVSDPCSRLIGITLAEVGDTMDLYAECLVRPDTGIPQQSISGRIIISQPGNGGLTRLDVDLQGFNPDDRQLKHGFHIHGGGQLGNNCKDAGGHYNPDELEHGGADELQRHVGDLGNVEEDGNGRVQTRIIDSQVSLIGPYHVVGRSIVIHEVEDDLGDGGFADSKKTGHAGARLACCKITRSTGVPN